VKKVDSLVSEIQCEKLSNHVLIRLLSRSGGTPFRNTPFGTHSRCAFLFMYSVGRGVRL